MGTLTQLRRFGTGLAVFAVAGTACSRDASGAAEGLSDADLGDEIAKRIEVRENPAIFALFVMLNAAGYDEERGSEMHPVRRAVRSALPRLLADSAFTRVEAYFKAHATHADLRTYSAVAMATSGPPNYTPTFAWTDDLSRKAEFRELAGLPAQLRAFHRAFPVDSVYRTHLLAYRTYIIDYTTAVRREVAAALRYCRVRERGELAGLGDHGRVVVIPNLLMSHQLSFSFAVDTTFYSVEGPQSVVTFSPHEFIHAATTPLGTDAARFAALQQKAAPAWAAVQDRSGMSQFASLSAFVDENLVRAIALRYHEARDDARQKEVLTQAVDAARSGMILVPYFVEQLARYEDQTDPLRAYYPRLFDRLDGPRELARWRDSIR